MTESAAEFEGDRKAVAIGASAGAFEALSLILPKLPANFTMPIMVVVHLPPDNHSAIADLFASKCRLKVCEAEDKAPIETGAIYFAPPNYHLLVEPNGHLSLSSEEPVHFSRPSIDRLLESAADAYGEKLIGIVLTGANRDGAQGLAAVEAAGGAAWVQEPSTAQSATMPAAALKACRNARPLTLERIAAALIELGTPA